MEEIQKVDTIVVNGVDIPLGGQGGGSGKILHKWKIDLAAEGVDFSEDENNFADVIEDKANAINHDIVIDVTPAGMNGVMGAAFMQCMETENGIVMYFYVALQSQMLVGLNPDGSIAVVQMSM